MTERRRLDLEIEARGLLPSRSRARDAIRRGTVTVNGARATKPHQPVRAEDMIHLDDAASGYVSRAALKLIAGLEAGGIAVAGRTCLDLGASTGGFTQVLLERHAARVYAVDVGHGQLHPHLQVDARVVAREGVNARDLDRLLVPDPIDLLVCDVSFVSLLKVLEAPLALCQPAAEAVLLIKPQFEVGRRFVGKGGIVSDDGAIAGAVTEVKEFMAKRGWAPGEAIASPIAGGDGNRETVAVFARGPSGAPSVQ